MNDNRILNLDGQPFSSFLLATKLRDLLICETGRGYVIEKANALANPSEGGFVVIRADSANPGINSGGASQDHQDLSATDSFSAIQSKSYYPALIIFILYLPLLALGLGLVFFPGDVLLELIRLLGIENMARWVSGKMLIDSALLLGVIVTGYAVISFLLSYYSNRLVVGKNGVTWIRGIVARETIHIRYSEIKTVGMRQGFIDRLLNMGRLELASSGSDGFDIQFKNLAHPERVKNVIQGYANQAG